MGVLIVEGSSSFIKAGEMYEEVAGRKLTAEEVKIGMYFFYTARIIQATVTPKELLSMEFKKEGTN
jgi:hypothetical protein